MHASLCAHAMLGVTDGFLHKVIGFDSRCVFCCRRTCHLTPVHGCSFSYEVKDIHAKKCEKPSNTSTSICLNAFGCFTVCSLNQGPQQVAALTMCATTCETKRYCVCLHSRESATSTLQSVKLKYKSSLKNVQSCAGQILFLKEEQNLRDGPGFRANTYAKVRCSVAS